jgi:hypothetical protein
MSRGPDPQPAPNKTTAPSGELSDVVLPKGEEFGTANAQEEEIRSRVVVLLNSSTDTTNEAAAAELTELLEGNGWQGQLARTALIEELISYEESALRSIANNESPSWRILFASHIADFATVRCGKEMTEKQRARHLECIEGFLAIAALEDTWGAGAVKLLEHAVTTVKDLFLWSEEPILARPERARLGSAYLAFLSKHDLIFQDPELYSKLVSPISNMVEALAKLGTPRRGESFKALFTRINQLCEQLMEGDEGEGPFIRDPIDQIADLAEDKGSWPMPDTEKLSAEERLKYGLEAQELPGITDDTGGVSEGELSRSQDDDLGEYDIFGELEDEEFEDEDFEDDEFDDEAWRGEDEELEEWRGDASTEGSESSAFADKSLDTLDTEDFERKEADEAESALREMQGCLAKAMRDCPSLGQDVGFWSNLVFERGAFEPGSAFFTQAYARTSSKALGELLLAIPLSMQEEPSVVVNLVALLQIEKEFAELYGMDIAAAYGNAIMTIAEDDDIIELQNECSDELGEEGYQAIPDLVDATIRDLLTDSLEEDWSVLEALSELSSSGDEMRALVDRFIRCVWGGDVSEVPSE